MQKRKPEFGKLWIYDIDIYKIIIRKLAVILNESRVKNGNLE